MMMKSYVERSVTADPSSNKVETSKWTMDNILVICFCGIISLTSLRVLCAVICKPGGKLRLVSILVAHLSSITICHAGIISFEVLDKCAGDITNFSGYGICEMTSFLKNTLCSVFPLNVILILHQSIGKCKTSVGRLPICKMIGGLWILAGVGSLPSIFTVGFEGGICNQVKVALFGDFGLTILYEVSKIAISYGLVTGYVLYALIKLGTRSCYLYILKPIQNRRMRMRVRRARFICFNAFGFLLMWIPTGVLMVVQMVFSLREDLGVGLIPISSNFWSGMRIINLGFFVWVQIVYLGWIENISPLQFCFGSVTAKFCFGFFCKRQSEWEVANGVSGGTDEAFERQGDFGCGTSFPTTRSISKCTVYSNKIIYKTRKTRIQNLEISEMSRYSTLRFSKSSDQSSLANKEPAMMSVCLPLSGEQVRVQQVYVIGIESGV